MTPTVALDGTGDRVDRIDTQRRKEVWMPRTQFKNGPVGSRFEPVDDDTIKPCLRRSLGDFILLAAERCVCEVRMNVYVHGLCGGPGCSTI